MEEMDFERRRELRRQKREEMRLEAERWDMLVFADFSKERNLSSAVA